MNCKKCSYELFKDFKFCYECGEKVDEAVSSDCRKATNLYKLKCHKCGTVLYREAKFCHNCGETADAKKPIKKKDAWGWVSIVGAFIYPPVGTIVALILSIILLAQKDQNKNLALGGLIFSSAILILLFVIMPLL